MENQREAFLKTPDPIAHVLAWVQTDRCIPCISLSYTVLGVRRAGVSHELMCHTHTHTVPPAYTGPEGAGRHMHPVS